MGRAKLSIGGRLALLVSAVTIGFAMFSARSASSADSAIQLDKIKLPPGFEIGVYAAKVPNARTMALGKEGTLFVGSMSQGVVYAVLDHSHANRADEVIPILKGLKEPNGVAFRDGSLYVAESFRITRYDNIESNLKNPPAPITVTTAFPQPSGHSWKHLRFGPDGKLYVTVGSPCNVCEREDKRYSTILRLNADGSASEVFANGVRDSQGFDWDPASKEMWFTDNGRDLMGDDIPDDELNRAPEPGLHFGFPYCHAGDVPDPEFGKKHSCKEFVAPALKLGAHVAALGMRFYTGKMFPSEYHNQIFIAEHGSWNRSVPIGYRIVSVRLEGNRAAKYEVFAEGWLQGEKAWGRPVDVQVMPDGALLVSDDRVGAIYRISYHH